MSSDSCDAEPAAKTTALNRCNILLGGRYFA
jgi:hypothetical protein